MKINDENFQQLRKEASIQSSLYKGQFLNEMANLEIMMDAFLAHHFCKDSTLGDFITMILPSNIVIFENKRVILKKIIEKYYPHFKNEMPNYFSLLEKLRDYRNKFAHYPLDITFTGIEKFRLNRHIYLLDNNKKQIEIKIEEIEKQIEKMRNITNLIIKYTPF